MAWATHDATIRWTKGDEKSRLSASRGKPAFQQAVQEAAEAFDTAQADRVSLPHFAETTQALCCVVLCVRV